MINRDPGGPVAESGKCPESGIRNSNPDSGIWKYNNKISYLLRNPESRNISLLTKNGFCKYHSKINRLEQNPESGFSSLKGRCHPQKRGVAPSREPIWWDDG